MALYCVKFKLHDSQCERNLDLNYGSESEAKDVLCRQSSAYREAIILSVRKC